MALSFVAALALSSGASAQGGGGGGGGGAGGAGSGAGGASGAAGTRSNCSISGPNGNSVAQPSGGQSSPTGIPLLNPPAVRAKIALIPQGRELGRGARRGALVRAPKSKTQLLQRCLSTRGGYSSRDAGRLRYRKANAIGARQAPYKEAPYTHRAGCDGAGASGQAVTRSASCARRQGEAKQP